MKSRIRNKSVEIFLFCQCPGAAETGNILFRGCIDYQVANEVGYDYTKAHELGHGAYRLRHTFSEENRYREEQGKTSNLMDYVPAERAREAEELKKYQWDYIHDPEVILFARMEEEEEGEMKTKIKGTPVVFFGDTVIKKERLFIYRDTSKMIKVKFETSDTSKTKVAYQIITIVESNNTKLTYPKSGYDTLIFNQVKEIRLGSIPNGKYTMLCKLKYKTIKNKKEVEVEKEFTTSFFIRDKKLEITKEQLREVFTGTDTARLSKIAGFINKYAERFGLVSVNRMSHFLAQIGYESDGFKGKKGEGGCYPQTNPNWSIWFNLTWKETPFCNDCNCDTMLNLPIKEGSKKLKWTALECKKEDKNCYAVPDTFICKTSGKEQDSLFLSFVYQCEGGNGNSSTGDGYKYRGHGAIQLTWKKTYEAFDKWLKNNYPRSYKNVLANPSIIDKDEELFILSALWFWGVEKKLNDEADEDNILKITKSISNSESTKEERKNLLDKIKNEIK